jgi:hypothetical protein
LKEKLFEKEHLLVSRQPVNEDELEDEKKAYLQKLKKQLMFVINFGKIIQGL